MISASGTVPRMAPVHVGLRGLTTAALVAPSSRGDASDDVTLVAAGTEQYRWSSSHATSEWGLSTTFPRDAALEAVSSGDRTACGRYTACGRQVRSHPQTDLMESRAVVYSGPTPPWSRMAGTPPQSPGPPPLRGATR